MVYNAMVVVFEHLDWKKLNTKNVDMIRNG